MLKLLNHGTLAVVFGLAAIAGAHQGTPPEDGGTASDGAIAINVNGEQVFTHLASPQVIQGRVFVPMRGVLEKLGIKVEWFPQQKAVVASKGDQVLTLGVGANYGTMGGKVIPLNAPARIVEGRTLVPLRYLAETLGAYVFWDEDRHTVVITTKLDSPVGTGTAGNASGNSR